MKKVTIRKMNESDIHEVQLVARTTWNHTYQHIIPLEVQEKFLNSNYSDKAMMNRMGNSLVLVAEVNDKIVGFANFFSRNENEAQLGAIYILPFHQGEGIGTKLLEAGIQQLKVKLLFVSVEKENETGKHFYYSKGFELIEEQVEEYQGITFETLRMKLSLL